MGADGALARSVSVARLDAGGSPRWLQRIGGADDGRGAIDVAIAGDGTAIAAGHAGGAGFVVALRADGTIAWRHDAAPADPDLTRLDNALLAPRAVAIGGDTVYVGGFANGAIFELGGNLIDAPDPTGFLAAFDLSGRPRWARSFAGRSGGVLALATAPDGDVVAGGELQRRIDLGGGTLTGASDYGTDGFAARYSPSGGYRWSRRTALGEHRRDRPMRILAVAVGPHGPVAAVSPGPGFGSAHHLGCVVSAEPP
jgi:outer membrane protein assembly factor BamB